MVPSEQSNSLPVIFLMGPTASGKTALAVELVRNLPLEIVSVDSAMVYRNLDIGTAKPSAGVLAVAPHRLIDICDPAESYSAGSFCRDACTAIAEIHAAGKIPLLVGGTGLYFRSLEQGFSTMPAANQGIRDRLTAEASEVGWQELYRRLAAVDPVSAARIHPNDPQRIQRALEIYEITGQPLSVFHRRGRTSRLLSPLIKVIVAPAERARLNSSIHARFMEMLDKGLIQEVRELYRREDLSARLPSMSLVGYRHVWSYLDGRFGYEEMVDKAVTATRQLAKRQLTWLRSEQNAHRVAADYPEVTEPVLDYLRNNPLICARV